MLKKLLLVGAVITVVQLERKDQIDLFQVAMSTFDDISGFCGRNPTVCDKGNKVIGKMANKAETGARMMVNLPNDQDDKKLDGTASLLDQQGLPKSADDSLLSPGLVASNERFPSYKDHEYNEHYAAKNKIIDPKYYLDANTPLNK